MRAKSWRVLAIELLPEKGPLWTDEMVELIAERGFCEISGRTPSVTVAAALYTASNLEASASRD